MAGSTWAATLDAAEWLPAEWPDAFTVDNDSALSGHLRGWGCQVVGLPMKMDDDDVLTAVVHYAEAENLLYTSGDTSSALGAGQRQCEVAGCEAGCVGRAVCCAAHRGLRPPPALPMCEVTDSPLPSLSPPLPPCAPSDAHE